MDVFSLGCIIHYCITGGRHPFGEQYERDVNIMRGRPDLQHLQVGRLTGQASPVLLDGGPGLCAGMKLVPCAQYPACLGITCSCCACCGTACSCQVLPPRLGPCLCTCLIPDTSPPPSAPPLQGCPEALNLVAAMVQQEPSQRPSMEAVLAHPLWWSEEQRLQFLVDISDRWGPGACWGRCGC